MAGPTKIIFRFRHTTTSHVSLPSDVSPYYSDSFARQADDAHKA